MKIKRGTLSNGIRYIISPRRSSAVTIQIIVAVGSRNEPPKYHGISHFLEHMFFKGTQKRVKSINISSTLNRFGASFNASTGKDTTIFYAEIDSEHTEIALELLSDMLFNSRFDEKDIELEKKVVANEINRKTDIYYVHTEMDRLLHGNTPIEHPIIGTKESVRQFNRQMIMSYLQYYYKPQNIILSVAGNFNKTRLLSKYFNQRFKYRDGKIKIAKPFVYKNYFGQQSGSKVSVIHRSSANQSYVKICFRSLEYCNTMAHIGDIFSSILTSGISSRLFKELREDRGLVYSVSSENDGYKDFGVFTVICAVENDKSKILEVIRLICDELTNLKMRCDLLRDDFEKAKTNIIGRTRLYMEQSDFYAGYNGRRLMYCRNMLTIEDFMKNVKKTELDDFINMSRRIFKSINANVVVLTNGVKINKSEITDLVSYL